ncbi:MAG: hypothetical protein J6X92_04470, partial [Bacteroidales bacterium]|nr:hypothetical protein [Bacteroidales bacterium]
MAAYAFLAKSFNDYKKATKDIFGEEGHRQIMERIRVENPNPPAIYGMVWGNSFDFGETDENEHLFYDEFSQRYFRSTFSQVVLAELYTNRNFALGGGEVSINDFYKFLGLDTPKELKDLYWWVCDSYCFIDFSHHLEHVDDGLNNDPVPCWVITMDCEPSLEPLE